MATPSLNHWIEVVTLLVNVAVSPAQTEPDTGDTVMVDFVAGSGCAEMTARVG